MLTNLKNDIKERLFDACGLLPPQGPNFFVIGASRSGTTALYHMLGQHPDIFMPRTKEIHYFDRDARYRKNLNGYRPYFKGYAGQKMIGEITPFYFYADMLYNADGIVEYDRDECAVTRIHHHYPDAKIIISLRNPFDRIRSMYKKNYYLGKIPKRFDACIKGEMAGEKDHTLVLRNRYDIHLSKVLSTYPAGQVHVMIFEDWIKDQVATMKDISAFLDISADFTFTPVAGDEQENTSQKYEDRRDTNIVKQAPDMNLSDESAEMLKRELQPAIDYVSNHIGKTMNWPFLEKTS